MFEFILANIAMVSTGVVLYLVVRSLPRLGETEVTPKGLLEHWITSGFPEKLDESFNTFAGKFLRRLRVIILKIDNVVSQSLQHVRSQENGAKLLDFKDVMGDREVASERENEKESKQS